MWIENVRVEVKASRAIDKTKHARLVSKALRSDSDRPFWMNYQQIKLGVCDVFVFLGVWIDRIAYWIMSRTSVEKNQYLSHQHRGGVEYQIGITDKNISAFDRYRIPAKDVADAVIRIGRGQT